MRVSTYDEVMQVAPKLVVTSASTFWRPEEAVESEVALAEFAELKERLGDRVEIGATTFSETAGQKLQRKARGWLKKLPYLALGAGSLGLAVASAGLLTPLAALGVAGAAAGGISATWLGAGLKEALSGGGQGLAAFHTGFEQLEFENLPTKAASQDGLREMSIKNMQLYPGATHLVHLNGHGHGAKSFAGLPAKQAHQEMAKAVESTGQKYDVVFYETCYGANWENLNRQAQVADYAVAFEDAIPRSNTSLGRIDLSDVLTPAADAPTPRETAVRLAREAGKHFDKAAPIAAVPFPERLSKQHRAAVVQNTDSTAVAVDLEQVQSKLSPALDRLGALFFDSLQDSEFRRGVELSRKQNLLEQGQDLVDMGGFLNGLRGYLSEPESLKALETTLEALDSAVLYRRTGEKLPLSGLSFHSRPDRTRFSSPATPAHDDPTLPQGWVKFIRAAS